MNLQKFLKQHAESGAKFTDSFDINYFKKENNSGKTGNNFSSSRTKPKSKPKK